MKINLDGFVTVRLTSVGVACLDAFHDDVEAMMTALEVADRKYPNPDGTHTFSFSEFMYIFGRDALEKGPRDLFGSPLAEYRAPDYRPLAMRQRLAQADAETASMDELRAASAILDRAELEKNL